MRWSTGPRPTRSPARAKAGGKVAGRPRRASAVARAREGWGVVEARPFPWIDADFAHAVDTLSSLARRWEVMGADGALELNWPDRLIEPVPPERRHRRPALPRR